MTDRYLVSGRVSQIRIGCKKVRSQGLETVVFWPSQVDTKPNWLKKQRAVRGSQNCQVQGQHGLLGSSVRAGACFSAAPSVPPASLSRFVLSSAAQAPALRATQHRVW